MSPAYAAPCGASDTILVEADRRHFHARREGSKDNETPDLFALDLAGVEARIRQRAKGLK